MPKKSLRSSHVASAPGSCGVFLGRDHETRKRKYHNRTIHGSIGEAQVYLNKMLHERDLSRQVEGAQVTLNEPIK
jgi:hypothetical protein